MLGVVAGLAVLGSAADVGARHVATSKIEQRVKQRVPEASQVRARIRSWPFLKVVGDGAVDEVGVTATRVVEKPLVFTDVAVDLRSVRISVTDLVTSGSVTVTRIGRGTVSLAVTEQSLEQAVLAREPRARSVLGTAPLLGRVALSVDAAHRQLVVTARGVGTLSLPLPGTSILPCTPAVAQTAGYVGLSCTFTRVPTALASLATG